MLRPSYIMEASPCLSITANWSILSVAQYRHAELCLLIKEWMLIHQNIRSKDSSLATFYLAAGLFATTVF
jgi:hypothetical protein